MVRDKKTGQPIYGLTCGCLVARTRFELVISALRGRRPKPLDERAVSTWIILQNAQYAVNYFFQRMLRSPTFTFTFALLHVSLHGLASGWRSARLRKRGQRGWRHAAGHLPCLSGNTWTRYDP